MGKLHGSLARAGKVRKQTPKVAKKERLKKNPKGKSKKREFNTIEDTSTSTQLAERRAPTGMLVELILSHEFGICLMF